MWGNILKRILPIPLFLSAIDEGGGGGEPDGKESGTKENLDIVIDGVSYTADEVKEMKKRLTETQTEVERLEELGNTTEKVTTDTVDIFSPDQKKKLADKMFSAPDEVLELHKKKITSELGKQVKAALSPIQTKMLEDEKAKLGVKYSDFKDIEKEVSAMYRFVDPDNLRTFLSAQGVKGTDNFSGMELAYVMTKMTKGQMPDGGQTTFSEKAKPHTRTASGEDKLSTEGYTPEDIEEIRKICKTTGQTMEDYIKSREKAGTGFEYK